MPVQQDLINEALAWLRVTEIGETAAQDEIAAVATQLLPGLIQEWVDRRVTTINVTAIPQEAIGPASKILGNRVGPKFGRPYDPDIDMREEQRLRDIQTQFSRRRGVGAVAL